jgi:hypothetical protein
MFSSTSVLASTLVVPLVPLAPPEWGYSLASQSASELALRSVSVWASAYRSAPELASGSACRSASESALGSVPDLASGWASGSELALP